MKHFMNTCLSKAKQYEFYDIVLEILYTKTYLLSISIWEKEDKKISNRDKWFEKTQKSH
jgi:hypothetical protein